jgi:hypothetical protein
MKYDWYAHRFADIILNADYALKKEMKGIIGSISFQDVLERFTIENEQKRLADEKRPTASNLRLTPCFGKRFRGLNGKMNDNA